MFDIVGVISQLSARDLPTVVVDPGRYLAKSTT
jgi:hypothetical protein